ncbi:hypothetical protein [Rhodococcus sp. UFZ-B548]|uniref:hypothetical protein n=1 Tax=Rhodococcus sp. UFZ-B548 TaxID=2742212 RepID=UPI0015F67BED|nr:hypothetical protein [Rhodococcus sp. UFZ-B548]
MTDQTGETDDPQNCDGSRVPAQFGDTAELSSRDQDQVRILLGLEALRATLDRGYLDPNDRLELEMTDIVTAAILEGRREFVDETSEMTPYPSTEFTVELIVDDLDTASDLPPGIPD